MISYTPLEKRISCVLTIYNQQNLVQRVLDGIISNASDYVRELIVVFDGCTDKTVEIATPILESVKTMKVKIEFANNVWETKANNIGFKMSEYPFIVGVQDDMIIAEKEFDQRMFKPFEKCADLLGVTANNAQNETYKGDVLSPYDVFGRYAKSPRDIFGIRDVIVRGPLMLDHQKLKTLNYLDETFAPLDCDDKDLCYRGKKYGYYVGAFIMDYRSDMEWGTTRANHDSNIIWEKSVYKNMKEIISRHKEYLSGNGNKIDIVIK